MFRILSGLRRLGPHQGVACCIVITEYLSLQFNFHPLPGQGAVVDSAGGFPEVQAHFFL
jgi:hypothetical protein